MTSSSEWSTLDPAYLSSRGAQRRRLTGYNVCVLYGAASKVDDALLGVFCYGLVEPEDLVDSIVLHAAC